MQIKKSGGKAFGIFLSAAEKKAMDLEIRRQLAEYEKKHRLEMDALILWQLHVQLGFGHKRLKQFYDNFGPAMDDLFKRYEMDNVDQAWLYVHLLKKYGIDFEKWQLEQKLDILGGKNNDRNKV